MTDLWDSVGGGRFLAAAPDGFDIIGGGLFPTPACLHCGSDLVQGRYGYYCRACALFRKKWAP